MTCPISEPNPLEVCNRVQTIQGWDEQHSPVRSSEVPVPELQRGLKGQTQMPFAFRDKEAIDLSLDRGVHGHQVFQLINLDVFRQGRERQPAFQNRGSQSLCSD